MEYYIKYFIFYYLERLQCFANNFFLYTHAQILLLTLFSKSSPIKYVLINKVDASRALWKNDS